MNSDVHVESCKQHHEGKSKSRFLALSHLNCSQETAASYVKTLAVTQVGWTGFEKESASEIEALEDMEKSQKG